MKPVAAARRLTTVVAGLFLLAMLAACGDAAPSLSASAAGNSDDILRYTCGTFPFRPEIMTAPARLDEAADTEIAAALRAHLAQKGPDIDVLPDEGWTLVGEDGRRAEFVAVAGDTGVMAITLAAEAGTWKVGGWGGCRPEVVLGEGLGPASWRWADPNPPSADTTSFGAQVTEQSCASGQSSVGRVVGPQLVIDEERVLVIFAVRPQQGEVFTCPGNPSTHVPVELPEPLGERALLDGGQLPFGDPLAAPR